MRRIRRSSRPPTICTSRLIISPVDSTYPMIPLAAFAMAACFAVDAPKDQILAGDLARGLPEWAALPPETPVALAPAPGVQRVLRFPELRRMAARWNVTSDAAYEICFI